MAGEITKSLQSLNQPERTSHYALCRSKKPRRSIISIPASHGYLQELLIKGPECSLHATLSGYKALGLPEKSISDERTRSILACRIILRKAVFHVGSRIQPWLTIGISRFYSLVFGTA